MRLRINVEYGTIPLSVHLNPILSNFYHEWDMVSRMELGVFIEAKLSLFQDFLVELEINYFQRWWLHTDKYNSIFKKTTWQSGIYFINLTLQC